MDVRKKLVEQAISHFWYGVSHDIFSEPVKTYAKLAIEALEKENSVTVQEWISVKDRLPEKDEIVIICTDDNFIYAGELVGDTWFLDNDSWTATVTYWMPIPQPPKGE